MSEFKVWAECRPEAPFAHLFPDGRVPLTHPIPSLSVSPAPLLYEVQVKALTATQLEGLAGQLVHVYPDLQSQQAAAEAIEVDGLFIAAHWLQGITVEDSGMIHALLEPGEYMEDWEPHEDDLEGF